MSHAQTGIVDGAEIFLLADMESAGEASCAELAKVVGGLLHAIEHESGGASGDGPGGERLGDLLNADLYGVHVLERRNVDAPWFLLCGDFGESELSRALAGVVVAVFASAKRG